MDGSSEYQDARDALNEANDFITQPVYVTYFKYDEWYDEYNDEWYEEETEDSVQIDISQFFTNPLEDLKELVPSYVITAGTDYEWEYIDMVIDWYNEENHDSVSFTLSESMFEIDDEYGCFDFEYQIEYLSLIHI